MEKEKKTIYAHIIKGGIDNSSFDPQLLINQIKN